MSRLRQLVEDEQRKVSAARVGLWATVALAYATIICDIALTVHGAGARVPNTAYALEATMFSAFAAWAAGPRIAQYLLPQLGAVVGHLTTAIRDVRLPSRTDDERGDPAQ